MKPGGAMRERTMDTGERWNGGDPLLFESHPHPMWVYDRETLAFLAVNDAAVERYGYSQEEFLALTIRDIRPPEEIPVLLETLALGGEGFGEGGPQRHRKKDGTVIDVSVAGHALTFEGRLAKLVVAEDVTARRRTERRLRTLSECVLGFGVEARQNIQRLVEVCGQELGATWALYTRVEEGTLRHWGRWGTPEDLVISAVAEDHLCSEVIRRGGTEPVVIRDLAENARAPRDPNVLRYGMRTYLGQGVMVEGTCVGVLSVVSREERIPDAGELAFLGVVAGAVRVEERRRMAEEAVRHRSQQLEAVRAVSAEITRELDVTTLLNLISRRVVELVQASGAEIFLWCDTDQVLVRRAAQGEARQWEDARRRLGEGAVGTVALRREGILENEYARAPYAVPELVGRAGIRGVLAEPLLYRGRLLGVLVATDDDPAHRFSAEDQYSLRVFASQAAIALENARLFADLNEAYGRLQLVQEELLRSEKLRGLGQVAGGVVYQLNNMLSVVIGQVEDVGAHVTDPRLQEGLALVATAAADGVEMVRRLQGFSERRPEGRLVPCDLAEVVREALSLTRPRWKDEAERDGRTIRVETDLAGLPGILGDAGEIREALATLILHAVDMMPTGGALQFSARHEFAAREDFREGWVVLTVRDTGIGMPERMRARIFDPLFAAKVPGGRMGLAVVDRMIRRHGGEVGVTSLRGEGTTFTLRFRATTEQVGAKPVVEVPLEATRRILFVDDNPGVLLTTTRMLEDAGQIVVGATGGKMALERLMEGEVDLVLTDLGMPEMNGWEVAEAVKARYPQVPVVILTGWGEQAVVQETRRQVFVDRVLFKPVQRNVLLSTIAMLTGKVGS